MTWRPFVIGPREWALIKRHYSNNSMKELCTINNEVSTIWRQSVQSSQLVYEVDKTRFIHQSLIHFRHTYMQHICGLRPMNYEIRIRGIFRYITPQTCQITTQTRLGALVGENKDLYSREHGLQGRWIKGGKNNLEKVTHFVKSTEDWVTVRDSSSAH